MKIRIATPFAAIVQYFKGAYRELLAVTWPDRNSIIRYTILVIVTILISVAVIFVIDYGLQQLTDRYLIR